MKKTTFVCIIMLLIARFGFAQIEITRFLGIPIDGTKEAMIQKLKNKGYRYNATFDRLEGEFNGKNVYISVVTNNNKVYRIFVEDAVYSSEGDIKIRFNTLCRQFQNNQKYMRNSFDDYEISDEDDISYEMLVHTKRYQAAYLQINNKLDSVILAQKLQDFIFEKYGEDLTNVSETDLLVTSLLFAHTLYEDNSVWFMINEKFGEYGILMFYDNNRNRANGEEL